MNNFSQSSTFKTPEVQLDASTGVFTISGRVFPENPIAFFEPIISWLNVYAKSPAASSELIFTLTYFNSSANEFLFRICKIMESLSEAGKDSKIVWEYESDDEDMMQMGEDYKELLKINFEIKAIK